MEWATIIIGCALSLVVVGLVMFAIRLLIISPRSGPQNTQSVCGGCQYPVTGLSSLTCPECGGDLRRVGILTPTQQRNIGGRGTFRRVAAVAVLLLAGMIGLSVMFSFVRYQQAARARQAAARAQSQAVLARLQAEVARQRANELATERAAKFAAPPATQPWRTTTRPASQPR